MHMLSAQHLCKIRITINACLLKSCTEILSAKFFASQSLQYTVWTDAGLEKLSMSGEHMAWPERTKGSSSEF